MCDGVMAGMGLWMLLPMVTLVAVLVLAVLGSVWLLRQLRGGADRDNPASRSCCAAGMPPARSMTRSTSAV